MPTFDIVSEIDRQEVDNALNQARKELVTRFDFKGSAATIETPARDKIALSAVDATRLKALHEIVVGKLAKRNVDLRNVEHGTPAVSSMGHARQELTIKQGIEGVRAKEIITAIKAQALQGAILPARRWKSASTARNATISRPSSHFCGPRTSGCR